MVRRRAAQFRVGGEGVLGLGDAHRVVPVAAVLQLADVRAHFGVRGDVGGVVDLGGDRLHLVPQARAIFIHVAKAVGLIAQPHDLTGQLERAAPAVREVGRRDHPHVVRGDAVDQQLDFMFGVFRAAVDGHRAGQAVAVVDIVDVSLEVYHAAIERGEILALQVRELDAAVVLERAHGGHDHRGAGLEARLAAHDIDELLRAQVGAESGLGHDVVGKLQRGARRDHRVAAVRNVGERTAVDEGRVVLERLHQIGRERRPQQCRHRAVRLELARQDG